MTSKDLDMLRGIYAYPEFRLSPNTIFCIPQHLRKCVLLVSIEDMKNSIKVITETDGNYSVKSGSRHRVNR